MQQVPVTDIPSQTFSIALGGQSCRLTLRTFTTGLYCDLYIDDALVLAGAICENRNRIVRNSYLGFEGDLMFVDTQGMDDPSSPGLGARFLLLYLEAADLAAAGIAQ